MPNYAGIIRTVFQTLNAAGDVVDQSYGVRVCDDYANGYSSGVEDLNTLIAMSPADIVELAYEVDSPGADIINHALASNMPILIDDIPYTVERSGKGFAARPFREGEM